MALVKQNDLQDENMNQGDHESEQHEPAARRRNGKAMMASSLHHSQTKSFMADVNVLDSIQSTENDNMTDTDV